MKFELIDDVHQIWRRWSVRYSMLGGALVVAIVTDPGTTLRLLDSLPDRWSWVRPVAAFVLVTVAPVLLSALRQKPKTPQEPDA